MEIRRLDPDEPVRDQGLVARRLMPWPLVNAPFDGSWCVVRPGAESGTHGHREHEVWVAVAGVAEIVTADGVVPFAAGDVVHFRPYEEHQVVNRSEEDFQFFAAWWDLEMAERFAARDEE
ncbi:mannose-6-phosphate isomerase-like protein (cupin superfamily) [Saccharothrix tamanrassetensis]|uniref:Mannose-6-phosphate isomerase-like protein (Cupin superfamily) n=1 Tax=Saccharothrix tamanrassetensis TaxID=1051531 RepID=A0A841CT04_9PSEU|nr:cupin domain-containing protein [Saccharothrix tamanrassetensis]MBB5959177.1 mannose-6-phosphate isomerase-like protein (cupin superfamily) [Saccharothrix tamanrassetensis]